MVFTLLRDMCSYAVPGISSDWRNDIPSDKKTIYFGSWRNSSENDPSAFYASQVNRSVELLGLAEILPLEVKQIFMDLEVIGRVRSIHPGS